MEQLSLFGEWEGRPPPAPPRLARDVLFYALMLGREVSRPAARLVAAQRERHGITGPMRPEATLHISVLGFGFIDELSEDDVARAGVIANAVAFIPFELSFVAMMSFGGRSAPATRRALVLTPASGSDRILVLAEQLKAAMIAHGVRPRAFAPKQPHLTLLYDTARMPPTPLEPPLDVAIDGFSLVHSHRGQGRYTILWSSQSTK
ncbi:MAG TPA: 2'-5' RNA ligase family protein [Devosia sp.]|nr:2'-5' RNA ligase family protein [Devosia sp.]